MHTRNSLSVSPKKTQTKEEEIFHLNTSDSDIKPPDVRPHDSLDYLDGDSPLEAAPTVDSAQLRKIGDNLGKLASLLCLSDEDEDADTARDTGHIGSSAVDSFYEKKSNDHSN